MNTSLQLLRQPLRTAAVFLLLSIAGVFLCLSFGVLLSAKATTDKIQESFLTIALPTNQTKQMKIDMGNGQIGYYEQSVITPEMWEYILQLPQTCPAVKGVYQQRFISAWCPTLSTVTSAQENGRYFWYLNRPYNDAVFVVTIKDIGAVKEDAEFGILSAYITATVEQAVLLHPGYMPRGTLRLSCIFYSREELEAAKLEVGRRYLVYGRDYIDDDLGLRTSAAEYLRCSPDEIDWNNISYDGISEFLQELERHNLSATEDAVAFYGDVTAEKRYSLTQSDLNSIDAATLTVDHPGKSYSPTYFALQIDGTSGTTPLAELLSSPTIAPLDTDLDEFLASAEGAEWADVIAQTKIRHKCVPIIGTDLLESMYLFQQNDAFIVAGRTFTGAEYQNGEKACVISETAALASGLKVGDRIDLSFYWGADPYNELMDNSSNLMAQSYSQTAGFMGGSTEYEIVGIYRQSGLWEQFSYAFTPNTIFVPNASLPELCYTGQTGVFFTLVLKNGGIEEVRSAIAAQGYAEDTLLYYDNGFIEISDTLNSFYESAVQLFAAACATWLAALTVYLTLFVYHQRRAAGLMLLMGAGKQRAKGFIFAISMIPVAASSVISAVIGALLLANTLQHVFSSAGEILSTSFSGASVGGHAALENTLIELPWAIFAAAIAQMMLYASSVSIFAKKMASKSALHLLKK